MATLQLRCHQTKPVIGDNSVEVALSPLGMDTLLCPLTNVKEHAAVEDYMNGVCHIAQAARRGFSITNIHIMTIPQLQNLTLNYFFPGSLMSGYSFINQVKSRYTGPPK